MGRIRPSYGGFYTFAKLVLLQLLVLVVRDSVTTLGTIAYDVYNNLSEILLAIIFSVYSEKVINRSRLVLKVAITKSFCCSLLTCGWWKTQDESNSEGQSIVFLHFSLKITVFGKIQHRYIRTSGSSASCNK